MKIQKDIALSKFTTFAVGGNADYFVEVDSAADLVGALQFAKENNLPIVVLGGGSNMVVSDAGVRGLVIKVNLRGVEKLEESEDSVLLKIASGEPWDGVVQYAVNLGLWGIENLSHIPGLTGAVAVQNVGAYGHEAGQVVEAVETVSVTDGTAKVFANAECAFAYRSSIFNTTEKGRYVITAIIFRLSKIPDPNLSYGDVKKYFSDLNIAEPALAQIREAVIAIRDKKFPYPREPRGGSSGSFFKAHAIPEDEYERVIEKVLNVFGVEATDKLIRIKDRLVVPQGVKVPYGYLIELCGLKGKSFGNVSVCETHAGVLLNATGLATAADVLGAFKTVRQTVYQKTGVILQNEPELIGFTEQELREAMTLDGA